MRKNLLITVIGIGGGQGVLFLASPVIARIYSPAEFGEYAFVLAIAGILSTVASLRFDLAIPSLPNAEVRPIFHIAIFLTLFLSPVMVIVGLLLASNLRMLALPVEEFVVWVVFLVTAMGLTNVCLACFVRHGNFRRVSMIKIYQPALFCLFAITGSFGLKAALLVSWVAAALIALWYLKNQFSSFNFGSSRAVAIKNRKYAMLSSPMALLDTASLAMPLLFIAYAFGEESAGNFSQVQRLLAAPLILLGVAATQVFYKHAGDLYRKGESIHPLILKLVLGLGLFGIMLIFLNWIYGERLLSWLLGNNWHIDKNFIILAVTPMMIRMVVSPASSAFQITGRLGIVSMWQGAYFIVTSLAIYYALGSLDLNGYLLLVLILEAALYLVYFILALRVARSEL